METYEQMTDKETSLGKALRLLETIGANNQASGVSVAELVNATGLSRPTTYRFLTELQDHGFVQPTARQSGWQLGPKILAFAAANGSWSRLRTSARQAMADFVRQGGFTVHLGIRDGAEVVYLDKAENPNTASVTSTIGQRRPVNVTALGKCLVAFDIDPKVAERVAAGGLVGRTQNSLITMEAWLDAIQTTRREGIAWDREECELGLFCVAAPIRDEQGHAVAAISSTAFVGPNVRETADIMARDIRKLAEAISIFNAE